MARSKQYRELIAEQDADAVAKKSPQVVPLEKMPMEFVKWALDHREELDHENRR
jgi:hypothetical protein